MQAMAVHATLDHLKDNRSGQPTDCAAATLSCEMSEVAAVLGALTSGATPMKSCAWGGRGQRHADHPRRALSVLKGSTIRDKHL